MTAIHWLNPISGSFTNGADWSGGVVPSVADDAILDAVGAAFTVTSSSGAGVQSLQLAANATLAITASVVYAADGTGSAKSGGANDGTITATGFDVGLQFGGRFDNAGIIDLNGAELRVDSNATLSGGGQVVLQDGTLVGAGGFGGGVALTNLDNTISGSGFLVEPNFGALQLVNAAKGVINATDNSRTLVIDAQDGTVVNAGLIEATGKAGLQVISGVIDDSAGGTLLAGPRSAIMLYQTAIIGGVLGTQGSGVITTTANGVSRIDGTAFAVSNKGHLVINDGQELDFEGEIVNSGKIFVHGTVDATLLRVLPSGVTLSGGGTIAMRSRFAEVAGLSGATVLVNDDNTIIGRGRLGGGELTLVNRSAGVIESGAAGGLAIDTSRNAISNAGLIASRGPGGVTIKSAVVNTGVLEADAGVLTVLGAVSGAGDAVSAGGTLSFRSAFSEDVTFSTGAGVLELAQSQAYAGTVSGFSTTGGTALDLDDIAFVGASEATFSGTENSGVLTVTDGVHTAHIILGGDYLSATFVASSDGRGGTTVTATSGAASAPPHRLIAAMAHLGGSAGEAIHPGQAWSAREAALARPHAIA